MTPHRKAPCTVKVATRFHFQSKLTSQLFFTNITLKTLCWEQYRGSRAGFWHRFHLNKVDCSGGLQCPLPYTRMTSPVFSLTCAESEPKAIKMGGSLRKSISACLQTFDINTIKVLRNILSWYSTFYGRRGTPCLTHQTPSLRATNLAHRRLESSHVLSTSLCACRPQDPHSLMAHKTCCTYPR